MCSPVHAIKQTRYRVIDHGLPQPPVLVPAEHERAHDPRVVEAHAVKLSRDKVALKDRVGAPARGAGRDSVKEPEDLKGRAAESRVARRVSREGRRRAVLYLVSLRRQVFETARMNLEGLLSNNAVLSLPNCSFRSLFLYSLLHARNHVGRRRPFGQEPRQGRVAAHAGHRPVSFFFVRRHRRRVSATKQKDK